MKERVAFIGLGAMGAPMARNLLRAGFALTAWNRTPAKALALEEYGATAAERAAEAVSPGAILVTMLSNDEALLDVVFREEGVLQVLGKGGIHLSMSTVSPDTARTLAAHHEEFGVAYVAAPVFGRPEAADKARLWIPVSGDGDAKVRVRPLLEAMGRGVVDLGEDPGAANVFKLAGNLLLVSAVEAMGEALAFAEANGVTRDRLTALFSGPLFKNPVYEGYGAAMAAGRYLPAGFSLALARKDVGLVKAVAEEAGLAMPLAYLLGERLARAVERGRGDWDLAALALESESPFGNEARSDP